MADTNLQVITDGYLNLGVIDENEAPSPEQGTVGLRVLNDMLARMNIDGIRLGWFPQVDPAETAPIDDADLESVKYLLAAALSVKTGVAMSEELKTAVENASRFLAKRYVEYFESDLTQLPWAQGGPFGYGRY